MPSLYSKLRVVSAMCKPTALKPSMRTHAVRKHKKQSHPARQLHAELRTQKRLSVRTALRRWEQSQQVGYQQSQLRSFEGHQLQPFCVQEAGGGRLPCCPPPAMLPASHVCPRETRHCNCHQRLYTPALTATRSCNHQQETAGKGT
jgi:hypothetical protein